MTYVVASIQPNEPTGGHSLADMQAQAWATVQAAAEGDAKLIVLPEFFNVQGMSAGQIRLAASKTSSLHHQASEVCRRFEIWLLLPLAEQRDGAIYNSAHLYDPAGQIVFTYDKTHLATSELEDYGITPGDQIDVIHTPLGCIGIMTCFDVYVPEVAQTLAHKGAQIILFPSLQRSDTPERCMILARARAIDTACYVVRSAYGQSDGGRRKNACFGHSCIIAPDGAVLANADRSAPSASAAIDLSRPWSRASSFGKPEEPVRDFLGRARRPHLYRRLAEANNGLGGNGRDNLNQPATDNQSQ